MTLVRNTTITRTYATAQGTDKIPLGLPTGSNSASIDLDNLKAWLGSITDKITEGDSKVEVVDTGTGYITVVLDNVELFRFITTAIEPTTTNTLDIGTSSKQIKDIHLAGGIELGSDATGDIYYRDSTGKFNRLGIGASGKVLGSNGTNPLWTDTTANSSNFGKSSLVANTPSNLIFVNVLSGVDADVVLMTNAYDSSGNSVVVTITNITTTGFTAEASTNCTLHYYSSTKTV